MDLEEFPSNSELQQKSDSLNNFMSCMDEDTRRILKLFDSALQPTFTEDQRLSLLAGYASGISDEYNARKDATDLSRFYIRKQWTEEEMEDFQVMILSKQGMDGVAVVFENHPMYRRITGSNSIENSNHIEEGISERISSRPKIVFVDQADEEPHFDEEITKETKGNGYITHPFLILNASEIYAISIPSNKKGVICLYHALLRSFRASTIIVEFDLLRSFMVHTKCIIYINCYMETNPTHAVWRKVIEANSGIMYNFADPLIPNDSKYCRIILVAEGIQEETDVEISIMGIKLSKDESTKQKIGLIQGRFDPLEYGFHPVFKIAEK